MDQVEGFDPEMQFLASKQETGNEWELFKENVRPLKRGRNVRLLNDALKSHTNNHLKKSLLETRRFLFLILLFYLFTFIFVFDCLFHLFLLFLLFFVLLGGWLRQLMSIKGMILCCHGSSTHSTHYSQFIFIFDSGLVECLFFFSENSNK